MKTSLLGLAGAALAGNAIASLLPSAAAQVPERAIIRAVVTDGDTMMLGGRTVRIWGVDAPEAGQDCQDGAGRSWRCGRQASRALAARVAGAAIACHTVEQDRYGRDVARCSADGEDLGTWLVRSGWALDYKAFSANQYADEEAQARADRLGVWRGSVTPPWEWRAAARAAAVRAAPTQSPPEDHCRLKGNINASGRRIVHAPGQRDYAATRIDQAAGERWFCTLEEAEQAGWRPAAR